MNTKVITVVTTIQTPTASIRKLHEHLCRYDGLLIAVGDRKGPETFELSGADFLHLSVQRSLGYSLADLLPEGHYARKNIGYLRAMGMGATRIYETDDDNAPMDTWIPRSLTLSEAKSIPEMSSRWINVYRYFSSGTIWPRGLPLDKINSQLPELEALQHPVPALVQQGLVNRAPDVDAIWRLIFGEQFIFDSKLTVYLHPGNWCPFNSQNTWWWPPAFPLLYIPSFCSFRMCDIWRSFIAQRCLWAIGSGVTFFTADAEQERNVHRLMKDFEDEVPGYLLNDRIAHILENLKLSSAPSAICENLRSCYGILVEEKIFPAEELKLVDAWLSDVGRLQSKVMV